MTAAASPIVPVGTQVATPIVPPAAVAGRPLDVLFEIAPGASAAPDRTTVRGGLLPADLAARYGPRLEIPVHLDRPTLIANFVATIDGAVALDRVGATGGREISGSSEPDRFVMGLLRATADAVLVGAGTVRSSRTHAWTAAQVHPAAAAAYDRWRATLGLDAAVPTTVMISASGDLEPEQLGHAGPDFPLIIVTTSTGATRLASRVQAREGVEVAIVVDDGPIPAATLVDFLADRGFRLVLCEGGPTLFGELVEAGAIDELFLTVAPQLVGRSAEAERLGLVERTAFGPSSAPWGQLVSIRRAADHLFLRYGFDPHHPTGDMS
jgi:riboflavin biosynthesis pyrimidine reductase